MSLPHLSEIVLPALAGSFLLVREAVRAVRGGILRSLLDRRRRALRRVTDFLVRTGIANVPGIRLADPGRPGAAGEAVLLAGSAATVFSANSAVGILLGTAGTILCGSAALVAAFRNQAGRQLRSFRSDLPRTALLLSMLLDAGMGIAASLQESVRPLSGSPLGQELGELVRERSLGGSREDAYERSRDRVPLEEYRVFLNLLEQGERLGTGLSRSLRELSGRMLDAENHRAEESAQKASVKLLAPLVLLLFPAVFLIILSPILLGFFGGNP